MFYLVYKTTNILNGKYYIGMHATTDKDDGYLGSGKLLKRAINKHGTEAFEREVLIECISFEQMNAAEQQLVDEAVVNDPRSYNLVLGGKGGWEYVNKTISDDKVLDRVKAGRAAANAKGIHILASQRHKELLSTDNAYRENWLTSVRAAHPGHLRKGVALTEEHRSAIREARKGKATGNLNSQYGTCWVIKEG